MPFYSLLPMPRLLVGCTAGMAHQNDSHRHGLSTDSQSKTVHKVSDGQGYRKSTLGSRFDAAARNQMSSLFHSAIEKCSCFKRTILDSSFGIRL